MHTLKPLSSLTQNVILVNRHDNRSISAACNAVIACFEELSAAVTYQWMNYVHRRQKLYKRVYII